MRYNKKIKQNAVNYFYRSGQIYIGGCKRIKDWAIYIKEFRDKFEELETLKFIDNKENIILIGTPGSGKTHYSIAISTKAILKGKSVLFVSVPNLIIELKEALSKHQLNAYYNGPKSLTLLKKNKL